MRLQPCLYEGRNPRGGVSEEQSIVRYSIIITTVKKNGLRDFANNKISFLTSKPELVVMPSYSTFKACIGVVVQPRKPNLKNE